MADYHQVPLFGGAIVVDLPTKFADVSKLRQVPDNQEVFIDKDGFTTVMIDLTERVGGPGSGPEIDGKALTTHLTDIIEGDEDSTKVWSTTETQISKLGDDVPAYTLIATQTPHAAPDKGSSSSSPDFTAVILTLVRLEKESTDIVITVNVPHIRGEYKEDDVDLELGKQGKLIGDAVEYCSRIWESFAIKDWGLFAEV